MRAQLFIDRKCSPEIVIAIADHPDWRGSVWIVMHLNGSNEAKKSPKGNPLRPIFFHPHTVGTRMDTSYRLLGWLMGLEPTTTGITILDSTN
jgi:hypothetical protein